MLDKLKNYLKNKKEIKDDAEKIKVFIINKNKEILDIFKNQKKLSAKDVKKNLIKIRAVNISHLFSYSFNFKEFVNLKFTLTTTPKLSFGCYGVNDLNGFRCDLIENVYFLVHANNDEENEKEIKKLMGDNYKKIKEIQDKILDKDTELNTFNLKTTKKAKVLAKIMINNSSGYINQFSANEMFK